MCCNIANSRPILYAVVYGNDPDTWVRLHLVFYAVSKAVDSGHWPLTKKKIFSVITLKVQFEIYIFLPFIDYINVENSLCIK